MGRFAQDFDIRALPSAHLLQRSIYVDVKAAPEGPPVLFTMVDDDRLQHVVTDTVFADAALAKDLQIRHFEDQVEELIERCERDDRMLIVFGADLHDQTTQHSRHQERLSQVLTDVRPVLLQTLAGDTRRRRGPTLVDFMRKVDLPISRQVGSKQTAQRIRYVRQQLFKHDAYSSITGTAKAKWTKFLQQGEQDCRGLQSLLKKLATSVSNAPIAKG
ncbi:MAG: hypothetical protein VYC64_04935 [Candidatus Latescibacterota bacterium]|nr:hypothetical protein [Candidatus Latescibacterota bacterium]